MNKNIVITILLIIMAGVGSFFGGIKYQESRRPANGRQFNQQFGQRNGGPNGTNRNGFRPVAGEIIANDDKSITVKLTDGSSKIVLLSDKTTISKSDIGAKSDLKTSEKVVVFGIANSDGSITALSIQLNPTAREASPI